jgi:hypothetical protein
MDHSMISTKYNKNLSETSTSKVSLMKIVIHVLMPISIGIIIYMLFRGIPIIDPHGNIFPIWTIKVPEWAMYNIPDGLWMYSLLFCTSMIWAHEKSYTHYGWLTIILILSITSEFLQKWGLITGTFDLQDIYAYLIATTIHVAQLYSMTSQKVNIYL